MKKLINEVVNNFTDEHICIPTRLLPISLIQASKHRQFFIQIFWSYVSRLSTNYPCISRWTFYELLWLHINIPMDIAIFSPVKTLHSGEITTNYFDTWLYTPTHFLRYFSIHTSEFNIIIDDTFQRNVSSLSPISLFLSARLIETMSIHLDSFSN
jgi:hypothetical protein